MQDGEGHGVEEGFGDGGGDAQGGSCGCGRGRGGGGMGGGRGPQLRGPSGPCLRIEEKHTPLPGSSPGQTASGRLQS